MSVLKEKDGILTIVNNLNSLHSLIGGDDFVKVIFDKDNVSENVVGMSGAVFHFFHGGNIVLDITVDDNTGEILRRVLHVDNDFIGLTLREKVKLITSRKKDGTYTRHSDMKFDVGDNPAMIRVYMNKTKDAFAGLVVN